MLLLLQRAEKAPDSFERIDCTSRSTSALWKQLSPFHLGPVKLYGNVTSRNVENAWQFSKVYPGQTQTDGWPTADWFQWRDLGLHNSYAQRYPMGRSAVPLYSYWIDEHQQRQQLNYVEARWRIYIPLYQQAVAQTEAFRILKEKYDSGANIALVDFDGYNYKTRGMTLRAVIDNEKKKMGHCVALAVALGEPLDSVQPKPAYNFCQMSLF